MARPKKMKTWLSGHSTGNSMGEPENATIPTNHHGDDGITTKKDRLEEWEKAPASSSDGADETSSSSITTHSSRVPRKTSNQMLPPVLLKGYSHPTEDENEGYRLRSRYLHSLGLDYEPQHHDHPSVNSSSESIPSHPTIDSSTSTIGLVGWASCSHDTTFTANPPPPVALRPSPLKRVLLKGDYGRVDRKLLDDIKAEKSETDGGEDEVFEPSPIPLMKTMIPKKKTRKGWHSSQVQSETVSTLSKLSFDPAVLVREIPNHQSYSERIRRTIWMTPNEYMESITKNAIEYMAEGFEPEGVLDESDFVQRDGETVHPVCLLLDEPQNTKLKQAYYRHGRKDIC